MLKLVKQTTQKTYCKHRYNERPNSILRLTERDFLLWMRSAQEASVQELGYVTALPLCYCKPGYSDDILLRIQNSKFNFKQINFDIDRYIIDSTTGNSNEQYILFPNYEYNV